MNKKSHLIITTQLIRHTALEKHSFWVKLGAIMPDLLFLRILLVIRFIPLTFGLTKR